MKAVFGLIGIAIFVAMLIALGVLAWHRQWEPLIVAIGGGFIGGFAFGLVELVMTPLAAGGVALMRRRRSALAFPLLLAVYVARSAAFAAWCILVMWYFANIAKDIGPWLALALGFTTANAPFSWLVSRSRVPDDEYDPAASESTSAVLGCLVMAGMLLWGFSYFHSAIAVVVAFALCAAINLLWIFTYLRRVSQWEYDDEQRIQAMFPERT